MWTEIGVLAVILGMFGIVVKFQHSQIKDIRTQHKENLFSADGQSVYVPRPVCEKKSDNICDKIDKVYGLLEKMDAKREAARKETTGMIVKLARIEGQLEKK